MKIYTKTGDRGTTALNGGKRVVKNNPRVMAYGALDELNAHIGYAVSLLTNTDTDIVTQLHTIQSDLLTIGAHIATPEDATGAQKNLPTITDTMVAPLEQQIDAMEEALPTLTQFILPGGTPGAAQLHIARTVCRRAERELITIDGVDPIIFQYINRLSDWLFVCARFLNNRNNTKDIQWNN